eukprot:16452335-Heterocapsa_arctica.AAC.1
MKSACRSESGVWTATTCTAILPHELFAQLEAHSALADLLLTGGEANLRQWWEDAARCKGPWFEKLCQAAPCAASAAASLRTASAAVNLDRCVPIGMHGDDAGAHGTDKVTVITWGSVAVSTGTLDSRLVFVMLKDSEAPSCAGLDLLMQVLAWSLNALSDGVHPSEDQDGRRFDSGHHPGRAALAGNSLSDRGFHGVWAEFRGDWKLRKEALHLKQHCSNPDVCHRCAVTHHGDDPESWYTNFGRSAELRKTLHDPAEYLASASAVPHPSQLMKIRNFCISRVCFDIMHCLDLGVLQLAVPSALAELLGCNSVGTPRMHRLRPIAFFGRQQYRGKARQRYAALPGVGQDQPPTMRSARFSETWVTGAYPQIAQLQLKAAELRSMRNWMRDV